MTSTNTQRIAEQRRAKREQIRLEQRRRARLRRGLAIGGSVAGVAIVAVVVGLIATSRPALPGAGSDAAASGQQIIPATPTGATTVEQPVRAVPDTSGITGVLAWDTTGWPGDGAGHAGALEHQHVDGPVRYAVTPPVGGPHDAIWMNAGIYTKPIPNERAVHNMEHGAVWITYDPSLPADQRAALTAFVEKQTLIPETGETAAGVTTTNSNRYLDLSPWSGAALPAPIVMSAWGHQLRLSNASDPRMQQFVDTFRHTPRYSPEYGAAVDGIPVQTGGRPAEAGSSRPNPAGSVG